MPATERLEYPKSRRRTIPARDIDIPARSSGGSSVPPKIDVSTGGKGGTVVLITGVLFVGYLYFTRRLSNVFKAIQLPPTEWSLGTLSGPPQTVPKSGSTTPYVPTQTVPIKRVKIIIRYPPQFHLQDEEITVDSAFCKQEVYSLVLARTASPATAKAISDNVLCQ